MATKNRDVDLINGLCEMDARQINAAEVEYYMNWFGVKNESDHTIILNRANVYKSMYGQGDSY